MLGKDMNIQDYLIDQAHLDWSELLQSWGWLLPGNFTLWLVNRFAELIMVYEDGSVHMLRSDAGEVIRLADSRDHFSNLIDLDDNAADWLLIPLVDQCVASGMLLREGQCYAFKLPPLLGASYELDNIYAAHIAEYLPYLADIHKQLHGMPDGTKVKIKIVKA